MKGFFQPKEFCHQKHLFLFDLHLKSFTSQKLILETFSSFHSQHFQSKKNKQTCFCLIREIQCDLQELETESELRNIVTLKLSPSDLNTSVEQLFVRWDYSSHNPSGAVASLPLSGCVGVHHAGWVHPGANGQRLLLHAGRGPTGQVVLDPEHLRGPRRSDRRCCRCTTTRANKKKKKSAGRKSPAENLTAQHRWSLNLLVRQQFLHKPRNLKVGGGENGTKKRWKKKKNIIFVQR